MKAAVQTEYGAPHELVKIEDVDEPALTDDGVLVRVRATSVNPADWHLMRGDPRIARLQMGLRRPKHTVLGCDVAGQVDAVGEGVTRFAPGDEVYGCTFMRGFGGFAEVACVPDDCLAPKPASLSFEQAAAVPIAALTALQGLRDHGGVESGHKVLIVGASGGVGTFAVQIAKSLGAEVTGVCSGRNAELVRSLGADHVVDYTQEDFAASGQRYDVVLQVAGKLSPSSFRRVLTPKGTLVSISGDSDGHLIGPVSRTLKALVQSPFVSQRLVSFTVKPNADDLEFLNELVESGGLTVTIDQTYPLAEIAEAIRYLEDGHARGKVVVRV